MKRSLGVLLVLATIVGCEQFTDSQERVSVEQLGNLAIEGDERSANEAAKRLADELLAASAPNESNSQGAESRQVAVVARRVLSESDNPAVRSEMAEVLGTVRDLDALPQLIVALDDEGLEVRESAATAVRLILQNEQLPYDARWPAEKRKKVIALLDKHWQKLDSSAMAEGWRDTEIFAAQQAVAREKWRERN